AAVARVYDGRHYHFVPLIEGGERALARQIGIVHGAKIAVEVGGRVKGLAESVVGQHGEVRAEMLLHLQDRAFIDRRTFGRVHILLEQGWYGKAGDDRRAAARRQAGGESIVHAGVEVVDRYDSPVSKSDVGFGRARERVLVESYGQANRMYIDTAEGNTPTFRDLTLNAKLSLLRVGALVVRL